MRSWESVGKAFLRGPTLRVRSRCVRFCVASRHAEPAAATPVATTRHTALGTDWHTPAAARHPGFFYSFRVVSSYEFLVLSFPKTFVSQTRFDLFRDSILRYPDTRPLRSPLSSRLYNALYVYDTPPSRKSRCDLSFDLRSDAPTRPARDRATRPPPRAARAAAGARWRWPVPCLNAVPALCPRGRAVRFARRPETGPGGGSLLN